MYMYSAPRDVHNDYSTVMLPSDRVCDFTHVVRGSGKNHSEANKPRRHCMRVSLRQRYSPIKRTTGGKNQAVPDLMT